MRGARRVGRMLALGLLVAVAVAGSPLSRAAGGWPLAFAAAGWPLALASTAAALVLRRRLELVARAEHELRGPATVVALAAERLRGDPDAGGHGALLEAEVARLRAGLADLTAARRGRGAAGHGRGAASRGRGASWRGRGAPGGGARAAVDRLAGSALAGWRGTLERTGRAARFRWSGAGTAEADPLRVGQVLGNLVANAVEHGSGDVEVHGRRSPGGLRVEVRSGGGSPAPAATGAVGEPRRDRALSIAAGAPPERGRGLAIARSAARQLGGRLELTGDGRGALVAALELPLDPRAPGLGDCAAGGSGDSARTAGDPAARAHGAEHGP